MEGGFESGMVTRGSAPIVPGELVFTEFGRNNFLSLAI